MNSASFEEGLRGRTVAGLQVANRNGFGVTLQGSYDGIGEADYEAMSLSLRLSQHW